METFNEGLEYAIYRVPPNYANEKLHWRDVSREGRNDKASAQVAFRTQIKNRRLGSPQPPLRIRLTLCCKNAKRMDRDNLLRRLKYVRDEVARNFGISDDRDYSEGGQIAWSYAMEVALPEDYQTRDYRYGVLVEVASMGEEVVA